MEQAERRPGKASNVAAYILLKILVFKTNKARPLRVFGRIMPNAAGMVGCCAEIHDLMVSIIGTCHRKEWSTVFAARDARAKPE